MTATTAHGIPTPNAILSLVLRILVLVPVLVELLPPAGLGV